MSESAPVAQVIATVVSASAFLAVLFQIRMARRSADRTSLNEFVREIHAAERRVFEAKDGPDEDKDANRRWALNELFDLIEVNAASQRSGLFHGTSENMVVGKLKSLIALIDDKYADFFAAQRSDGRVFEEIDMFRKRHMSTGKMSPYLIGQSS